MAMTAKQRIGLYVHNKIWPMSYTNLWTLIGIVFFWLYLEFPLSEYCMKCSGLISLNFIKVFPEKVRIILAAFILGTVLFIPLIYIRRIVLKCLLAYRDWMYEVRKSTSVKTKIWGVLLTIFSGSNPKLLSNQSCLPRLHVPDLKDTISNLLVSLKPLYTQDGEEFEKLKKEAEEFARTDGVKLQRALKIKSWLKPNYVSDWWIKYVYHMGRSPIPINSNYYILDQAFYKPSCTPAARAACFVDRLLQAKEDIENEVFEPLIIQKTIPLCMEQLKKVFGTTRIPGEECDRLEQHFSKHIVVQRKGIFYAVEVFDKKGNRVPTQILEKNFVWILEDAESVQADYNEAELSLAALTGVNRTSWYNIRKDCFSKGINKESLDIIDKAIIMVCFDDYTPPDFSDQANRLLRSDGKTLWFDKSLTTVFFENGKCGIHCEHSMADAPIMAVLLESCLGNESFNMIFNDEGGVVPVRTHLRGFVKKPERLLWDIPETLQSHILQAVSFNQKNNEDTELIVKYYSLYGKGLIKTFKVSPDAYLQMAIQLTYYKLMGKCCLTYEASMTRLYLNGRTETVRSLTAESLQFVESMQNKSATNEERVKLLRLACDMHQNNFRDSMNGKGVDRHLFALYVASRGMGYDCEFLKKVLGIPWTLSTSQAPQIQLSTSPSCDLPIFKDKVSPGGGFGPVTQDGYGVAYMIAGERQTFFHVSAKKSSRVTDAGKFIKTLFESLGEMKDIFKS